MSMINLLVKKIDDGFVHLTGLLKSQKNSTEQTINNLERRVNELEEKLQELTGNAVTKEYLTTNYFTKQEVNRVYTPRTIVYAKVDADRRYAFKNGSATQSWVNSNFYTKTQSDDLFTKK